MRPLLITAVLGSALLFACSKSEKEPEGEQNTAAEATTAEAPPQPPIDSEEEAVAEEVPTVVDFEEDAEVEITEENFEEQLTALEKELEPG